jgi:hypothetical protein
VLQCALTVGVVCCTCTTLLTVYRAHCACVVAESVLTLRCIHVRTRAQLLLLWWLILLRKAELKVQLTPRYRQLAHEMKCTEVLLHLAQDAFEAQEGVAYEQVPATAIQL